MSGDLDRAVILVDHGSRAEAANLQLDEAAAMLADRLPGRRIVTAHMELAEPGLPEAIDSCIVEGVREITVGPVVPGCGAPRRA